MWPITEDELPRGFLMSFAQARLILKDPHIDPLCKHAVCHAGGLEYN